MGLVHCFENERGEITHCIPVYQLVRNLIPDWWWEQAAPGRPSPVERKGGTHRPESMEGKGNATAPESVE